MLSSFDIYSLLGLCYFKHYEVLTFILSSWIDASSCTKYLEILGRKGSSYGISSML